MKQKFCVLFLLFVLTAPAFVFAASEDQALISMERSEYEAVNNNSYTRTKAALTEHLTPLDLQTYSLDDMQVAWFDKDCAAVTSKFTGTGSYNGHAVKPGDWRVTTVYVKKGGKWLATFHQETLLTPMEQTQQ